MPAQQRVTAAKRLTLNEESLLPGDLPGQAEYRREVRRRLVPGVW